jgi:peptidoglycan/LPS O-acetylase OafA/YrhL
VALEKAISTGRIPTLDGWRGIAIALVIIDHMNAFSGRPVPWLLYLGQHGVLIFFVLSGYLITSLLQQERLHTGSIHLGAFYLRRLFRLMPAAWLYLAIAQLVFHRLEPGEAWSAVLFYRNFYTAHDGQFGIHFWTLSMEEQFYLAWPTLLLLLGSRRGRWFALSGACSIAAWRFAHWKTLAALPFIYSTATQYRADSLLIGCAAALVAQRWSVPARMHRWFLFTAIAGIAVCIAIFRLFGPLGESTLIAFAIWSTANYPARFPRIAKILDSTPLTALGALSYSLYLWQQIATRMLPYPDAVSYATRLQVLASLALVSYYCVERPMLRLGRFIAGPMREAKDEVRSGHSRVA